MSNVMSLSCHEQKCLDATFRVMLLPSLGIMNDYVTYIYRKYARLDGDNVENQSEQNIF